VAFPAVAETVPQPQGLQGVRVGVARDEAFSFLYPANLEWLRQAGAEILFFSPLRDASIPPVDTLYLPGGYPELHLDQLAANESMKDSLRRHAEQAKPILAECGGMAYLAESLSDREGHSGAMCGILPGRVVMQSRLAGLGMQSADYPAGALRGHAFHYSRLETSLTPLLRARKRSGGEGEAIYRWRRVTASYLHLYFASSPETVAALLSP
jgi:cobyrinic acid a,c-diamide synthase